MSQVSSRLGSAGGSQKRVIGPAKRDVATIVLTAAWMSIAVGILLQIAVAIAAKLAGGKAPAVAEFIRDVSQKITWSTFVCVGLAVGAAAAKLRPTWVGVVGLLAAPAAFVVARTAQRVTATALGAAPPEQLGVGIFITILALKAAEYGALGAAIAWIQRRPWGGVRAHLSAGFVAGVIFGATLVAILYANAHPPMQPPKLAAQSVNELIFPVGCSFVLFGVNVVGKRLSTR